MFLTFSVLICLSCINISNEYGTISESTKTSEYENYEELYRRGVDAYLENNFQDCVKFIEDGIREYKDFNKIVNNCKLGCKQKMYKPIVPHQDTYYKHYEGLIQETLCLMNCKRGKVHPKRKEEIKDKSLVKDFESLKTYDYLQLCYFQTKDFVNAGNAAYTNLIANPDHEIMEANLKYYLGMKQVKKESLVNLEQPDFYKSYESARILYNQNKYKQVIPEMEKALELYFQEEDICRVQCEKPFDMGWFPDFISSVSNHFTFCLKCKLNCATSLHSASGNMVSLHSASGNMVSLHSASGNMDEELLASMFHYLQFSYFKVDNYKQALNNALTFIRFRGEDKVMENNIKYYRVLLDGAKGEVRQDARKYIEREEDELALVDYIEDNFTFPSRIQEKSTKSTKRNDATISAKENVPMPTNDLVEEILDSSKIDDQSPEEKIQEYEIDLISPPPVVTFNL